MYRSAKLLFALVVMATACGSSDGSSGDGASGDGSTTAVPDPATTTAPPTTAAGEAFSDPADAEKAALEADREACLQDLIAADPGLGILFDAAEAAGGAVNLAVEEHVTIVTRVTECSEPQLVSYRLEEADQPWLTKEQRDCLATTIKGSETQGMAYLGLLHLMNGRLEAPAWSGAGQDPAIIGATACVSPIAPLLGETVASLLEDPRTAEAVDQACLEEIYLAPEQRVNFWLQRYRRVVYREEDDEAMKLALEGTVQSCLNTGILYQASLWRERGIEISNQTATCIDEKVRPTDYARLSTLGDPAAEEILSTAAGECVTSAERAQFED